MEALRESEERFRTMADTAPVMIWVADPDKLCTYFNQQWLDFTGRTMGQEIGNGWLEGVHPEDVERCLEVYSNAFDRRDGFTMEFRLRRVDGKFRWVFDTGAARFSPGAGFLGYIGSCIDITERKASEEALANLSGQLIRAREDECARIARELHDDVNQRMALVSIELEQLGQKPDTPGALRRQLRGLLSEITETTKEIHRMSRDLHPSKLVHLGLVPTLKSLFEELRQRHGLRIKFTNENLPDISQDVSLCLYRIVQECLNNVIKHSGAEACAVELRHGVNEIRLRVSDAGVGFDIESPSIKKGLGLISMRERLRLVGGSISIDSKPSLGTRIDARVPFGREGLEYADPSEKDKTRAAGG
jgi:PAS domain S-box-containing protein